MFDSLSDKIQSVFKKLRGHGKLTENNISEALREVRIALLEADVNYRIVKDFINQVKEAAIGQITLQSISPAQQVIKVVHDQLVLLLGSKPALFNLPVGEKLCTVMLVGLQGSGKTTTCGKLGLMLSKKGQKPLLVACDIRRPAAIDQLESIGKQLSLPVFSYREAKKPKEIYNKALDFARENSLNPVIFDTQGRLHVDDELMSELKDMQKILSCDETLLVADAMTGQDAVKIGESFTKSITLDGFILSKIDGDSRGGAALSLRAVTGKPIKFCGTGEKSANLEVFHPDRIASRILGMGDIVSLVEKAEETASEEDAKKFEKKMKQDQIDLEDFLSQIKQIKKMGSLQSIMQMLPGMSSQMKGMSFDDRQLVKIEAIIQSMTPFERQNPNLIDGSRKKRISRGSGTTPHDINLLIKRFFMMKKMLKKANKHTFNPMNAFSGGM